MPKQILTAQDGSWHPKISKNRPGQGHRHARRESWYPKTNPGTHRWVLAPRHRPGHPKMGSGTWERSRQPKTGIGTLGRVPAPQNWSREGARHPKIDPGSHRWVLAL